MNVLIKYIWHDCFVIVFQDCVIITDFWKEETDSWHQQDFPEFLNDIAADTPLYIFVSHHHKDHFNRKIFLWVKKFRNIRYIISNDTAKSINYLLKKSSTYSGAYAVNEGVVTVLKPGMTYSDRHISARAFPSTDIGNSYLIECGGLKLFHAGDLNAWIWKDESTSAEIASALHEFQSILHEIKAVAPVIDVAFFPVDSRIGSDWWEGASIFVRILKIKYFFPMHFCLASTPEELGIRIQQGTDFTLFQNTLFGKYIALTRPEQSIVLNFP